MIFNSEIHRPSSAKLWHIPHPPTVFPSVPGLLERTVPLEEQETSYLADSASIFSLAKTFSFIIPDLDSFRKYTIKFEMRIEEKKFSKYINTKLVNFEEIKSYAYILIN